ncbi:putative ABC transporter ATP-binding protein YfmM [Ornithinibacillus bavariensis]|uniref:ABC transporter ATP-binding protein YfmM n=2 Tax=Ornithinibacillus bavariensis TaxID=545502 RepID=A0A919X5C9_9BACI|nr:putative ABC transporter ATP-binding protein YfmM [Ornithinibacillus bavariensis]
MKKRKGVIIMSLLTVKDLSHGFGDRAIFENVSFRLLQGEHIGLIGANGEGKSIFMNIITGKLEPDAGNVTWAKHIRVGYLDQHAVLKQGMSIRDVLRTAFQYLYDLEAEMNQLFAKMGEASPEELEKLLEDTGRMQDTLTNNDFYTIDAKVEEVANGLGLNDFGLDRDVHDLSGGQRTKVLLAKLLLEKPEILLLDEPTNYLDFEHIEWLKSYLQNYDHAFILVSHDIPFLNSVVNLIYHVENQELTRYPGDYNEFLRLYELKKQQQVAAYKKQQKEIANLKDFVARNKANAATARMAMSRQKKLDKMDVIELDVEKPKPEFNFKLARTPGKYLFETKDLVIGYGEPLSRSLNLSMERGQKIALYGANGIGKTTLLKSILGEITPVSGSVQLGENLHIGYFEQEIKSENNNTCIQEIWDEFPHFTQYEVRAALAKCGLTTKHIESKIQVLSGGEKAKVRLCKLINRETNLLVLDEPTNHLDPDAKEELKRALKEYKGSVLLISHEPDFYDGVVTDMWNCEDWTTKVF